MVSKRSYERWVLGSWILKSAEKILACNRKEITSKITSTENSHCVLQSKDLILSFWGSFTHIFTTMQHKPGDNFDAFSSAGRILKSKVSKIFVLASEREQSIISIRPDIHIHSKWYYERTKFTCKANNHIKQTLIYSKVHQNRCSEKRGVQRVQATLGKSFIHFQNWYTCWILPAEILSQYGERNS